MSVATPEADFTGPIPSRNFKSKADIWYRMIASSSNPIELLTHADFADVITVYSGACGALQGVSA